MILHSKKVLRLFFVGVCCLISQFTNGQYTVSDTAIDFTLINSSVQVLEDKTNALGIADVVHDHGFKPAGKNASFGLSTSTFWFKVPVRNLSGKPNYVLGIANASSDTVEMFKLER